MHFSDFTHVNVQRVSSGGSSATTQVMAIIQVTTNTLRLTRCHGKICPPEKSVPPDKKFRKNLSGRTIFSEKKNVPPDIFFRKNLSPLVKICPPPIIDLFTCNSPIHMEIDRISQISQNIIEYQQTAEGLLYSLRDIIQ